VRRYLDAGAVCAIGAWDAGAAAANDQAVAVTHTQPVEQMIAEIDAQPLGRVAPAVPQHGAG